MAKVFPKIDDRRSLKSSDVLREIVVCAKIVVGREPETKVNWPTCRMKGELMKPPHGGLQNDTRADG